MDKPRALIIYARKRSRNANAEPINVSHKIEAMKNAMADKIRRRNDVQL